MHPKKREDFYRVFALKLARTNNNKEQTLHYDSSKGECSSELKYMKFEVL